MLCSSNYVSALLNHVQVMVASPHKQDNTQHQHCGGIKRDSVPRTISDHLENSLIIKHQHYGIVQPLICTIHFPSVKCYYRNSLQKSQLHGCVLPVKTPRTTSARDCARDLCPRLATGRSLTILCRSYEDHIVVGDIFL